MGTQMEIASRLGVSQKTVSRVLNGSDLVKESTRRRVLAELREANYSLNVNARNLTRRRKGALGVLIPDASTFHSLYFLRTFKGINDVAVAAHYHLIFTTLDNLEDRADALDQVDGHVVFNLGRNTFAPRWIQLLTGRGKAVVVVQSVKTGDYPFVSVDNHQGGFDAANHLLDLGHRRIAYFGNISDSHEGTARLAGWREALTQRGVIPNDSWARDSTGTMVEDVIDDALDAWQAEGISAVFCWSDRMARALIYELRRRDVRVPRDMSVIGFDDDQRIAMMAKPYLTTMRQPFDALGATAAKRLFAMIDGNEPASCGVSLKPTLIERDTCAAKTDDPRQPQLT